MLHSFEDVTVDAEKFETFGRCFALMVFEQRGIFIVPHLQSHGTIVLEVLSNGALFMSSYFTSKAYWVPLPTQVSMGR